MTDAPQFLTLDDGRNPRRLALRVQPGTTPCVIWLGGFRSDMASTKAVALGAAARARGRAFVRFDYAGHGESEGRFEDFTLSDWLADAIAVIDAQGGAAPVLVGSSMGGWLALLAARHLAARGRPPGALVLIAPAVDFTEKLMWDAFPPDVRSQITENGVWHRPSAYAPEPYPITKALIEDGRAHLLLDAPLHIGVPIRILQGAQDPDVPLAHTLRLVDHLAQDEVALSIVPDGDHRLSREADIALLVRRVFEAD